MRVLTWNCRRASARHLLWAHLLELAPDVALLQEVGRLPPEVLARYESLAEAPRTRRGTPQRFKTALLVRGHLGERVVLRSGIPWVDRQLDHFTSNLLAFEVTPAQGEPLVVVSAYTPAWPLPREAYADEDVGPVKLPENPDIWVSDLLVPALRHAMALSTRPWVVGGDFNACETFDSWKGGPRGNARWLRRMAELGLYECLRGCSGQLTPTFRRPGSHAPHCQIDHLFVSPSLVASLTGCTTGQVARVYGDNLSDHLPIIAAFQPARGAA